jgi:hypothetical protein
MPITFIIILAYIFSIKPLQEDSSNEGNVIVRANKKPVEFQKIADVNLLNNSHHYTYNFSDFLYSHPVSEESSIAYARQLFDSGYIEDARKYSEMIILENNNNYAMEALPVLLSSYKTLDKENEFNRFVSAYIYNLSFKEDEESKSRLDNFSSNVLMNIFDGYDYSINEKKFLINNLTASGIPDNIKEMAIQFESNLNEQCRIIGCPPVDYSSYQ